MKPSRTGYRVIFSSLRGQLGGVDVFTRHLMHGLLERDIPAHILLTEPDSAAHDAFPFPNDLPSVALPVSRGASWQTRWKRMIRYLEEQAPCIYIPSYDYAYSCISPKLSDQVRVVGIVHGDDEVAYEYTMRLGPYWNAIVAVSPAIAAHVAVLDPAIGARVVTISNGVNMPAHFPSRHSDPQKPLQVVYAGRLAQRQKRILDLAQIATLADERNLKIEFTVIGAGPNEAELRRQCEPLIERGRVRFLGILPNPEALEMLKAADVMLLMSEFEGFPLSILEAMAHGCIPVVTDIRSGIPDLIIDNVNGYRVPVGDIEQFVARLELVQSDILLRHRLAWEAHSTICDRRYRVEEMVNQYLGLFECVLQQLSSRAYRRPRGPILPPKELQWQARLPHPFWLAGHYGKQVLRKALAPFNLYSQTSNLASNSTRQL